MTTEQPHDFQDDSQAVGPGQLLRNAREQLGWTREQVASRIHLRLTLIAAIEADRVQTQLVLAQSERPRSVEDLAEVSETVPDTVSRLAAQV